MRCAGSGVCKFCCGCSGFDTGVVAVRSVGDEVAFSLGVRLSSVAALGWFDSVAFSLGSSSFLGTKLRPALKFEATVCLIGALVVILV